MKKYLEKNAASVSSVVPFDTKSDKLHHFDFTAANDSLKFAILADTDTFSTWVRQIIEKENCRYGIGGYDEHRTIYSRSDLFDANEEPRRLHLGVDVWGPAGTPIFTPLNGTIHSFKFNDNFGDYGATLILEHDADGVRFHTLFGHLSLASIENLAKGTFVRRGEKIAEFGDILENGHWPPHLHFQIIFNMQGLEGDYPGVCRFSERESFLGNCPDPHIILKHTFGY
ncbi:peptidoglycan DD-metalloendopeptidase family protein [Daejeonella sp.]|uniref:peptidoglycan DD-metalloendopeptidase family protein n=1 Tax=Daejeonella sp. TaxID=2805397 RepID=UPI0039834531